MKPFDASGFESTQPALSPQEEAFINQQYVPGIISWMANIERGYTVAALKHKSDDPAWLEAAIADVDKARGYEETALQRLAEAGITIPEDDEEYMAIAARLKDTSR